MGPWKDIAEARKRRFLELYEAGASYPEIKNQLEIDEHDFRDWRDTILIFGASRFLMAHMSKTKYAYETKLAVVKAHVEDQIPHLDIMAKYGVTPRLLRRWCKIYSEHGEACLARVTAWTTLLQSRHLAI